MNRLIKTALLIILILALITVITAILNISGVINIKKITETINIPVPVDDTGLDFDVNPKKIKVYDLGNRAIPLKTKMAWTEQKINLGDNNTQTLCGDSQDFGYLYDEEIIAVLAKTKDIRKIEIMGETEYPPNYSVYKLTDQPITYSDNELLSSDTKLILPNVEGEYLVVITIVWIDGEDRLCNKYYFKYIVKKGAKGMGTVLVYDDDGEVVSLRSENMWSSTLVTNKDGSKGYLSADVGQLGFHNKDELISSLAKTTSVKQVEVTKEPWDGPYYTIYDATGEDINLVGASGDSMVYHGRDLILPNEAGEYIIGISITWELDDGTCGYKYFFKYIVE